MTEIVTFADEPPLGVIVRLDDQIFELVAAEPYTRKTDGAASWLITWESACPKCGEPFRCTSGRVVTTMTRRCGLHRMGSKPVKGKRGRKVRVQVTFP
jgi:hypothetical protein